MGEILHLKDICKSFSGVEVLHSVNLTLNEGEVLALVGENGAGKSTLMKILMGIEQPNSGEIFLKGKKTKIQNPAKALSLGIAMIHQELNPVPNMTVSENMYLGRELSHFGFINMRKQDQLTEGWMNKLLLKISPSAKLHDLSISETQMIEIAKAISYNSQILIMDEPTSAITDEETKQLYQIINLLKSEGIGIIYISHKLDELKHITDRVEVLRDGHVISVSPMEKISRQEMVRDMVGREVSTIYPVCNNKIGEKVMEVQNLTRQGEFYNISFSLYAGEKLGIAGLMGAGRTELVNSIFGAKRADSGEIFVKGKKLTPKITSDAIKNRIALVPEDRKLMGLNLIMAVNENITMCVDRRESRNGFLNMKKNNVLADRMINELKIKVHSRNHIVENLSGGNQQKVVLAKWLLTEPDILLFDEPTRGIDVGAKAEIFEIINSLVMEGKAAIVISSEMQELVGMSSRVLVLCEGRLTGELSGNDITQENIMSLASPQIIAVQ
ncbi:MAG: sugar ABC transporter ATP-binding protein [Chloroflexi bacterium]|nr:sugar ABC transporter ATP-binding protein [Chloroflexota bacterium]